MRGYAVHPFWGLKSGVNITRADIDGWIKDGYTELSEEQYAAVSNLHFETIKTYARSSHELQNEAQSAISDYIQSQRTVNDLLSTIQLVIRRIEDADVYTTDTLEWLKRAVEKAAPIPEQEGK
jgi:hypothetical protein